MHPDLLHALGRARHNDLLNVHPARGQPRIRVRPDPHLTPLSRARLRLGCLLIRAGARLSGQRPAALELAHE